MFLRRLWTRFTEGAERRPADAEGYLREVRALARVHPSSSSWHAAPVRGCGPCHSQQLRLLVTEQLLTADAARAGLQSWAQRRRDEEEEEETVVEG